MPYSAHCYLTVLPSTLVLAKLNNPHAQQIPNILGMKNAYFIILVLPWQPNEQFSKILSVAIYLFFQFKIPVLTTQKGLIFMQKKYSLQLSLISLIKATILSLMLFNITACGSSSDGASDGKSETTETETPAPASLDTALTNFKSATDEVGLTE